MSSISERFRVEVVEGAQHQNTQVGFPRGLWLKLLWVHGVKIPELEFQGLKLLRGRGVKIPEFNFQEV